MTTIMINAGEVSDGYHTFNELYDHRTTLFIALCRVLRTHRVWRSKLHDDGSMFDGWFILGIQTSRASGDKQITYHLPISRWDETDFASTLDKAPKWDGHTPADVLDRLKLL